MACELGSEKKESAPASFSTNDIGVICAIFNLEGGLCRLLDLIPDAIARVISFNFEADDAGDLYKDLLKMTAKRTLGLIYDELTGRIQIQPFCSAPPPAPLELPTYYDVFAFLADLVPILNHLVSANDVLTGNSTSLLDKIVNAYVREKWHQFCQCVPKPQEPDDAPSKVNPPIASNCMNSDDIEFFNNRIAVYNNANVGSANNARKSNNQNSITVVSQEIAKRSQWLTDNGYFNIQVEQLPDIIPPLVPPFETSILRATGYLLVTSEDYRIEFINRYRVTGDGFGLFGNVIPNAQTSFISGQNHTPFVITTSLVETCIPHPDPAPFDEEGEGNRARKSDFCALFPEDENCLPDGGANDCETEYVIVSESKCGKFRKPLRRILNVNGEDENIDIELFTQCDEPRDTANRVLLKCVYVEPPPIPCEDYDSAVLDWLQSFIENYQVYVGFNRPVEAGDLNIALQEFSNQEFDHANCQGHFESLISNYWSDYFAVYGCTDQTALNYNPDATVDNGSCEYE